MQLYRRQETFDRNSDFALKRITAAVITSASTSTTTFAVLLRLDISVMSFVNVVAVVVALVSQYLPIDRWLGGMVGCLFVCFLVCSLALLEQKNESTNGICSIKTSVGASQSPRQSSGRRRQCIKQDTFNPLGNASRRLFSYSVCQPVSRTIN